MRKDPPNYVLDFVFHPERDQKYLHFQDAALHPFQPDPSGFPRVNVWWLADIALLTYWDAASARAICGQDLPLRESSRCCDSRAAAVPWLRAC
jgi:hypothetical protein